MRSRNALLLEGVSVSRAARQGTVRAGRGVLKIARTIADLAGAAELGTAHVSEAIQYRSLDRKREFA
jgi:predicted ATPase with chaperone activity